jgi:HK97 gp10 family phage protein
MTISETNLKGFSELQKFLDELPVKMEANIMRGAMRAGVKPIYIAAKQACPVGEPSSTGAKRYKLYPGALRDSIRIITRKKGSVVSASVVVGGKNKKGVNVWYANLIEYTGAVQHLIVAKLGGSLFIGGLFHKVAEHPGMQAQPFMRPAFDSEHDAAILAAGEYIKNRLATKEGLDTQDIELGVEE